MTGPAGMVPEADVGVRARQNAAGFLFVEWELSIFREEEGIKRQVAGYRL